MGKILLYIPEGATDFIFAFSIGNYGILSAVVILLAYFFRDKIKNMVTNSAIEAFFND